MKLKSAKNLDPRQTMLLEHAYFQVCPSNDHRQHLSCCLHSATPECYSLPQLHCLCVQCSKLQSGNALNPKACAGAATGTHGAAKEAAATAARLHSPPAARCARTRYPAAGGFWSSVSSHRLPALDVKSYSACTAY
jgi:hypothetical protein